MCMCMQGYGSAEDVAGGSAYLAIQDELEDYANAHPEIRPIIDPLYLVSGSALKLAGPDGMGLSDRSRGNILFILGKFQLFLSTKRNEPFIGFRRSLVGVVKWPFYVGRILQCYL